MTTTAQLNVDQLVQAIQGRDANAQADAFQSDAVLTVIDHDHGPSNPLVIRGSEAIRGHLADVCARDMTHQVETAALAGDRLTVEVSCDYADGTKVECLSVSGVQDGKIAWQRLVQAWDS